MVIPDSSNEMFDLAVQLVNQSARSIFLTGKAGTGKTTFLKYIRENSSRQLAIVAPTGVAAINAGGVTIHSFFQLPLSPFIPDTTGFLGNNEEAVNRHTLTSRLRINSEKLKILRQLELLVIDEISMVRCDVMDAIDTVLRHTRNRPNERFGGVQLLLIGDMFQLPPVVKEPEWRMLSEYYSSPYFFDSAVIREEMPLYIEFNKIYRQSEEHFIRVLNQVRNNALDEEGFAILESRYQPSFRRSPDDGYIVLTTHNDTARTINYNELAKLATPSFKYNAEIKGDFPPSAFPADEVLELKVGSQVMFIKNDSDRGKRFFNGKIGTVTRLAADKIIVKCKGDNDEIEVNKETWENIRYSLNKTSRKMEEEALGSFAQYPLRLAWAITIHKSQGLTFDKAIIDAGEAFAPGQVYVALSRCTSLEGMVLRSRIRKGSLFTDQRILNFSRNSSSSDAVREELDTARKDYRDRLLLEAFDFKPATNNANEIHQYIGEHIQAFNPEAMGWINELLQKLNAIQETGDKFHIWLQGQFRQQADNGTAIQERAAKAASYFTGELESVIEMLKQPAISTDSKLHAKEINEGLKDVFAELAIDRFMLQGFDGLLDPLQWQAKRKSFALPSFPVNIYGGTITAKTESAHPALLLQLRKLRDNICDRKGLPIYLVASSATLEELVRYLPHTAAELKRINGFGDAKVQRYGQEFLDIILTYCEAKGLGSLMHEKPSKRNPKEKEKPAEKEKDKPAEKKSKPDTKEESYKLYIEGKSIPDIAKERDLTIQTIEGHLAYYVSKGVIRIEELVSREKLLLVEPVLQDAGGKTLTSIREQVGNALGFGEIKLAIAWKEYQDSLSNNNPISDNDDQ